MIWSIIYIIRRLLSCRYKWQVKNYYQITLNQKKKKKTHQGNISLQTRFQRYLFYDIWQGTWSDNIRWKIDHFHHVTEKPFQDAREKSFKILHAERNNSKQCILKDWRFVVSETTSWLMLFVGSVWHGIVASVKIPDMGKYWTSNQ